MTDEFQAWLGRVQTSDDMIDVGRANALLTTLGRPEQLAAGDPLPGLFHWIYFWTVRPPDELGRDGHPQRGGFLPALPDEWRRMWAGSSVEFIAPLPVGAPGRRVSTIDKVARKTGRTGELVFVSVVHEISGERGLAVRERQDIVYLAPDGAERTPPQPSPDCDWREPVDANSVLLFRYSALTFNGHRIHYDHPYATGVEGYAGLVVHGPLQATLMHDLAVRKIGRLSRFDFRGRYPACDDQPIEVCGSRTREGADVWTAQSGTFRMTGKAVKA